MLGSSGARWDNRGFQVALHSLIAPALPRVRQLVHMQPHGWVQPQVAQMLRLVRCISSFVYEDGMTRELREHFRSWSVILDQLEAARVTCTSSEDRSGPGCSSWCMCAAAGGTTAASTVALHRAAEGPAGGAANRKARSASSPCSRAPLPLPLSWVPARTCRQCGEHDLPC